MVATVVKTSHSPAEWNLTWPSPSHALNAVATAQHGGLIGRCGHIATSIHVTGRPQLPHPESLLAVEGYTRKYKSGGVEAGNETGVVTLNFCKEKVYALCTLQSWRS